MKSVLALGGACCCFMTMVASPLLYPLVVASFTGRDDGLVFFVREADSSE